MKIILHFKQNLEQCQNNSLSSTENRNSVQHYHTNGTTSSSNSNSLEPCKQSMSGTKNDQSPTKATTVTN